jgi:hypothetical protein
MVAVIALGSVSFAESMMCITMPMQDPCTHNLCWGSENACLPPVPFECSCPGEQIPSCPIVGEWLASCSADDCPGPQYSYGCYYVLESCTCSDPGERLDCFETGYQTIESDTEQ